MNKYRNGLQVMATNEFVPWTLAKVLSWDDQFQQYLVHFEHGRMDFCDPERVREVSPLELALKEE